VSPKRVPRPGEMFAESFHQTWCKTLAQALGFVVYDTSQGYRAEPGGTRTTAGLSDLILLHHNPPLVLFFEVKPPKQAEAAARLLELAPVSVTKGQLKAYRNAKAQKAFGDCVRLIAEQSPSVAYGYGSLPELCAVLGRYFDPKLIVRWLRVLVCPRDVQDAAASAAATTRRTPGRVGQGPVPDAVPSADQLPVQEPPDHPGEGHLAHPVPPAG
jgi:hypothetical protein